MKIRTEYVHPPIPFRHFDWSAVDDDTYEPGCPIGYGHTEQEAIDDLMEQIAENNETSAHCDRCDNTGWITVRSSGSMSFVCAGPAPDDARGVTDISCDECDAGQDRRSALKLSRNTPSERSATP
jgi:hypothetical protein